MRVLCAIIFILILLSSCGEPTLDRAKRIVDVRLLEQRSKYQKQCINDLLKEASEAVDSFIISRALADTTVAFVKPIKPDVPSLDIPELDTLGIKPLFEKIDTTQ